MIPEHEVANYEDFRDCVSELLISRLSISDSKAKKKRAVKGRKNEIKPVSRPVRSETEDGAELGETIEVRIPNINLTGLCSCIDKGNSISPPRYSQVCHPNYEYFPIATYRTIGRWLRSTACLSIQQYTKSYFKCFRCQSQIRSSPLGSSPTRMIYQGCSRMSSHLT